MNEHNANLTPRIPSALKSVSEKKGEEGIILWLILGRHEEYILLKKITMIKKKSVCVWLCVVVCLVQEISMILAQVGLSSKQAMDGCKGESGMLKMPLGTTPVDGRGGKQGWAERARVAVQA